MRVGFKRANQKKDPASRKPGLRRSITARLSRATTAVYFFAAAYRFATSSQFTAFQNAVWSSLQAIPFGCTITYRELANRIGRPAAR